MRHGDTVFVCENTQGETQTRQRRSATLLPFDIRPVHGHLHRSEDPAKCRKPARPVLGLELKRPTDQPLKTKLGHNNNTIWGKQR
jgi:hypothetical protein